jgi:phosphoribosylaminoimidazole-succinocarboxamide synthase
METQSKINIVLQTEASGIPVRRGKVRDVYDLGDKLLLAASDRISAFDVIMPNGIPYKGVVLTQISRFWFEKFKGKFENHIISMDVKDFPEPFKSKPEMFAGRSMLVKKLKIVPIECVVRGYITGSGWKEYQKAESVCGIKLPSGLKQCDKLPEPIYTPTTKADVGHDENMTFDQAVELVGKTKAEKIRDLSIELYSLAADYARTRGIIIADTKFEWATDEAGKLYLADEVLTPDSSRFWPTDEYQPGRDQPSFDKQFVRNYLETLNWNKTPPAPALPEDVVEGTKKRYIEAFEKLTGKSFELKDFI